MNLNEQQIEQLANTVRFQKKNHLKKVDNINEHVHSFTLTLKDEDLEYEWRLEEIKSRKALAIITCAGIFMQDVAWAFFASHVSIVGKAIKAVIKVGSLLSLYQAYFNSKVKDNKAVQEVLSQGNKNKWDIIQLKLVQQREAQRQFFWYQMWWFFFILQMMANDTQHNFETKMTELNEEQARIQNNRNHFLVGINLVLVALVKTVADIHWIIMGLGYAVFCTSTSYQVYLVLPDIFMDFVFAQLIIQLCVHIFNYKRVLSLKSAFLKTKKIQSLLQEQVQIFQHLPDGAVIHRKLINDSPDDPESKVVANEKITVDIRHLNITFKEMFRSYREKLRLQKATKAQSEASTKQQQKKSEQSRYEPVEDLENNSMQHDEDSTLTNSELNAQDVENSFLKTVYLQKSPYKIAGKMIKQIEDQPFLPAQFVDAIKDFESGQVYSVLTKDEDGNFNAMSQQEEFSFAERVQNQLKDIKTQNSEKGFLIYIVTQEVLFNEEISTITYFKDITFGVLYEQVKAQQSLETAISSALQNKMGVPLQTIIQNCQSIESSQKNLDSELVSQIKATRMLTNLMVCQLKDMQDWNELKGGKFKKVSETFTLLECLRDIFQMIMVKAKLKEIKINYNLNHSLPIEVIGDRGRFQQIALNLMTNAINHTTQGNIIITVDYDSEKQLINFQVEDTGIGIKPEDQENMFKIFKDSGNIGMGLTISREIANKYNGNITFTSKYKEGSTFAFTFELEDYQITTENFSREIQQNSDNLLDKSSPDLFGTTKPSYEVKPDSPRFLRDGIFDIREAKPALQFQNSAMDSMMNIQNDQPPVRQSNPIEFDQQIDSGTQHYSITNMMQPLSAGIIQKTDQEDTVVEDFEEIDIKI